MSLPTKSIQDGVITKALCACDIEIQGCESRVTVSYGAQSRILDEHLFPAFLVKHMCSDNAEIFSLVESLYQLLLQSLKPPTSLKLRVELKRNPSSTVIEFVFKQRKRKNKEEAAEE
jgi:hypothetical protein